MPRAPEPDYGHGCRHPGVDIASLVLGPCLCARFVTSKAEELASTGSSRALVTVAAFFQWTGTRLGPYGACKRHDYEIMGRRPIAQPRLAAFQMVGDMLVCQPGVRSSHDRGAVRVAAQSISVSTEGQLGDAAKALCVWSRAFEACEHEGNVDWTRLAVLPDGLIRKRACLVSRSCLDPCSLGVVHRARDPRRPVHVAQRPPCIGRGCQREACSGIVAWRR